MRHDGEGYTEELVFVISRALSYICHDVANTTLSMRHDFQRILSPKKNQKTLTNKFFNLYIIKMLLDLNLKNEDAQATLLSFDEYDAWNTDMVARRSEILVAKSDLF